MVAFEILNPENGVEKQKSPTICRQMRESASAMFQLTSALIAARPTFIKALDTAIKQDSAFKRVLKVPVNYSLMGVDVDQSRLLFVLFVLRVSLIQS